jgi:hypothetical protein
MVRVLRVAMESWRGRVKMSEKYPLVPVDDHRPNRVVADEVFLPFTFKPTIDTRAGLAAAPVFPGASLPSMLGKVTS